MKVSRGLLTALVLLAASGFAWAAGEKTQVEMKDAVVLPAGEICLRQVADVAGEAADAIGAVSLGVTPLAGNSRHVTKEQVVMNLRRAGFDPALIQWRGKATTCSVTIQTAKVTGEQLVQAAREYLSSLPMLKRDDARIEVEEMPRDYVVAASEKTTLSLSAFAASADKPWGRLRVFVKVNADERGAENRNVSSRVLATIPLMFLVTTNQKVVVAARAVKRGEMVERTHLDTREIVLGPATVPEAYVEAPEAAVGKVAVRDIPAGTVLTQDMVSEPLAVRRGDDVTLSVKSNHMEVVTKGVAQKDGYVGEMIPVKVFVSGKSLTCKIVASGAVELPL